MTQQKPPVLNIKMVPAGVDIVIIALRDCNLPYSQVAPLLAEISGQARHQLNDIAIAEAAKAEKEKAKAPKQPRKSKPAKVEEPADDPDPSDVLA